MPSLEDLWSSTEVRKLLRLFEADYRLLQDVLEAMPFPLAIVDGREMNVLRMNTAFNRVVERVPGFAGSHANAVEHILRDSDAAKRLAAATVTGTPQRRIRLAISQSERIQATIYPVKKREQFLLVVDQEGAAGGSDSAGSDFRVLQALPVPVYTRDRHGNFRYANPAFERLTGHSLPELLATRVQELYRSSTRPTDAGLQDHTCVMATKRGAEIPVALTEVSMGDGEFVSVVQPIGEEAREHERHAVTAALERVSGQVAHRLNNMLTVILSYSELISRRFGSVESLRNDLSQIVEAGTKAADLTSQLLTYSRGRPSDGGRAHVNTVLTEFRSLLEGVISDGVQLQMDLDQCAGDVMMNPKDLETVILNIVTNADEAIEGEGTIWIRTHAGIPSDENLPLGHRLPSGAETVTICVKDTGRGIPPDLIQTVFEPFVTTKPASDGLGLSVVQGILKKSAGMISIVSEVGTGTTVWVTLPAVSGSSRVTEVTPLVPQIT